MREDERTFARKVFGRTVPLDDILVTDLIGAGNEPFTAVSGPSTEAMPFVVPIPRYIFALNMGSKGFESCLASAVRGSFVRELARVWQGPASVARQRPGGGRANYEVGQPWVFFNDEQKASLVEDWVNGGMRTDDPRMAYIHTHIRRGSRA
jgi:hypothetical protein